MIDLRRLSKLRLARGSPFGMTEPYVYVEHNTLPN